MAETAALLADEVLPERPLRQWVLSPPPARRFMLGSRPGVPTATGIAASGAKRSKRALPRVYPRRMIDLGSIAGLHSRNYRLAAYCPTCDRWAVLPLADMIAAGQGALPGMR